MGLRAAQDVPPTFYVANARGATTSGLPRVGATFDGVRRDVTVQDIIAITGRRTPDVTVSQRRFRFAFIVVTANGETPTADQLAQLDAYRTQFEAYFQKAASQNATADTTLKKAVHLSAFPAVGVIQGGAAPIRIELESTAPASATFVLRTKSGLVQTPQSVTIPAGAREVTFTATGISEGADEIQVEPADPSYESVVTKVQVCPRRSCNSRRYLNRVRSALKLPMRTQLPYPGVTVQAQATNGGAVDRSTASTDADGLVQFLWRQQADSDNQLVATVASGPSLTITAGNVHGVHGCCRFECRILCSRTRTWRHRDHLRNTHGRTKRAGTDQRHDCPAIVRQRRSTQLRRALRYTKRNGGCRDSVGQHRIASSANAGAGDAAGIFFDSSTGLGAIRQNGGYLEITRQGLAH